MDSYTAVFLAEGFIEGTEEQRIAAWQYLHDTGMAYTLQGWFGRQAQALLRAGVIHERSDREAVRTDGEG